MKYLFIIIIILILLLATRTYAQTRAEEIAKELDRASVWRTWTSRDGKYNINGRVINYGPASKFQLSTGNGNITVDRRKISKYDQKFLRTFKSTFKDRDEFEFYNKISIRDAVDDYKLHGIVTNDKTPIKESFYDKVNARNQQLRQYRVVRLQAKKDRKKEALRTAEAIAATQRNIYSETYRPNYQPYYRPTPIIINAGGYGGQYRGIGTYSSYSTLTRQGINAAITRRLHFGN